MTNDYDKLRAMQACAPALRWTGTRTITEAWRDCERSEWMCWLLERIAPGDPRLRLAAADMAERVWGLIPDEPTRLAAAWAIGAARRGDEDEMLAASMVVYVAAYAATFAAADVATAAERAATYEPLPPLPPPTLTTHSDADLMDYARAAERAAQADILREYFSAREIGKLFRQAPA